MAEIRYCKKCGCYIPDSSAQCVACGYDAFGRIAPFYSGDGGQGTYYQPNAGGDGGRGSCGFQVVYLNAEDYADE